MTPSVGDRVRWTLSADANPADPNKASGWGVVVALDGAEHSQVEVHSFPAWLKELDGQFHPLLRCTNTWLTKF